MVVIRLSRGGAQKSPFYQIEVADQRNPRDGRFIERIGFYNPLAKNDAERLRLDRETYESWIAKGAQPSDRVAKIAKVAVEAA